MYTDPTLQLYRALGLTLQSGKAGPDSEKGDYIVQSGLEMTTATLKRATQMPIWNNPGHFTQLGEPIQAVLTFRRRICLFLTI
jgi:hypothetical protein